MSHSYLFLPIAQVNKHLPRTFGDGIIHQSHIDAMVQADEPLHELSKGALTEEEQLIGKVIADNLVEDGATLQMGIYCYFLQIMQNADLCWSRV